MSDTFLGRHLTEPENSECRIHLHQKNSSVKESFSSDLTIRERWNI